MAENVPPASGGDGIKGMPYYEKLKRDLRDTLTKKRLIDKNMAMVESEIFRQEALYLEETAAGNIIKGFDNYVKGSTGTSGATITGGGTSSRRKGTISEVDRVFSRSSVSFMRETSPPSSSHTTPSHAATPLSTNHPTPTSATSTKANSTLKKNTKKNADKDEDDEGKPNKRMKISYSKNERE